PPRHRGLGDPRRPRKCRRHVRRPERGRRREPHVEPHPGGPSRLLPCPDRRAHRPGSGVSAGARRGASIRLLVVGGALASSLRAAAFAPRAALAVAALPDSFTDQLVVGGFSAPVGMALLPDGRTFVIEQKSAEIRLIVNGAIAATDPVTTVPNVKITG